MTKLFSTILLITIGLVATSYGQSAQKPGTSKPKPSSSPSDEQLIRDIKEWGEKFRIPQESPKPLAAKEVVSRVLPSVVLVGALDESGETVALGSGFVFMRGYIATNLHVLKRASGAFVKTVTDGITYKVGKVVGIDVRHDLCVLSIADDSLAALPMSPTKPSLGDEIYAIGNPKGLEGTVSKGIVSSVRNDVGLIQIDAAISPGSSGGPIVNDRGGVIGIAVSSLTNGQNLNFAVPVEFLQKMKLNFSIAVVHAAAIGLRDRDKENLRGLVRRVTETESRYDYDSQTDRYFLKPSEPISITGFDTDGNKIEYSAYLEGKFMWKEQCTYDENGFLTKQVMQTSIGEPKITEFSFEQAVNQKVNSRNFSETDDYGTAKFVYDRDGHQTESSVKLTDGTLKRWTYEYDRNGFVKEERTYVDGKLDWVSQYEYEIDSRGNWTRSYETNYSTKYSKLGFTPASVRYRKIEYFGD